MFSRTPPVGEAILDLLRKNRMTIAAAESCTGGLVSSALTAIPGSSDVFAGGIVSYTNNVKHDVLGVCNETLETYSAVSEQCTKEMAEGAAKLLGTDAAFSVSGIAGPSGGTTEKPVGTVCFGFYIKGKTITHTRRFLGTRSDVRRQAVIFVLEQLENLLQNL